MKKKRRDDVLIYYEPAIRYKTAHPHSCNRQHPYKFGWACMKKPGHKELGHLYAPMSQIVITNETDLEVVEEKP